jgi:hypothetical protein
MTIETTTGQALALPVPAEDTGLTEQRKPWLAMGLILIAASAERMAAHLSGHEAELAYGTAVVAFACAVVIGARSRHRLMGKHLRRRFIAAVWGSATWLTYVAAAGLSWGAVATLAAVGSLLSLLYWREHRIYGAPEVLPLTLDDADDLFADRWKKNLSGSEGSLVGSRLTDRQVIRSGYRYTLRLVPGKHTVSKVQGMNATLRSGLELMPGQEVIIEDHPTLPSPMALITIVTKSTVQIDQPWPGPELAFDSSVGSVNLGPFADGEGIARWSVYRQDGIFGGFIQGGQGSGKSRMVEVIAMACASSISHPTTVWFGCGQNGDSSPLLLESVDYPATTDQAMYDMLLAAEAVMKVNGIENRLQRLRGFTPTAERPGLLIIVDEFHNFLDEAKTPLARKIQDLMVKIAREGRKVGVALILATQEPLLGAFGHPQKADLLRACLLTGNGVLLRSETNNAKQVFKVDIDPRSFPKLPGWAYLARPAIGERMAPFRGYFVKDAQIDRWARSFPWRELPTRQARYAGSRYARRREVAAQQHADDLALLDMLDAGMQLDLDETMKRLGQAVDDAVPQASFGDHMPGFARVPKFWDAPSGTVELTEGQSKVLAAIRSGHERPADIIASTGYSSAHVHATLNELMERELVERPRTGRYQPAA